MPKLIVTYIDDTVIERHAAHVEVHEMAARVAQQPNVRTVTSVSDDDEIERAIRDKDTVALAILRPSWFN